jgi:Flp pilus assembly protein TadG
MSKMMTGKVHVVGSWFLLRRFIGGCGDGIGGVAAIEFAVLATILIFTSVATADLGMGFYRKMQVQNAAQAGARYVMLKGLDTTGIVSAIHAATNYADIVASDPNVFYGCASSSGITSTYQFATCSDGTTAGRYVTVSTQAYYKPILTLPLFPENFSLGAEFTVRVP